ncbi:MAG: hypothetical protein RBS37_04285 [Bacteroidales bacterium]|jgi:hypothetical protein|nr:hypothetical protein [Bacteroidales bacterium]
MQKKSFVIRVNPAMINALERWAADEFRSVNGQIEWILNRALKEAGRYREGPAGHPDEQENKK